MGSLRGSEWPFLLSQIVAVSRYCCLYLSICRLWNTKIINTRKETRKETRRDKERQDLALLSRHKIKETCQHTTQNLSHTPLNFCPYFIKLRLTETNWDKLRHCFQQQKTKFFDKLNSRRGWGEVEDRLRTSWGGPKDWQRQLSD